MVAQWADWLGDRITAAHTIPRALVEREFRILLDIISELVGPLRREVGTVWLQACEHYGRIAATRARQGMSIMLRLNRVIDNGIAVAVVGYTDALIATLFALNGVAAITA